MLEKNAALSESLAVEEFAQALALALRRILAQEKEEPSPNKAQPDTGQVQRKNKEK